MDIDFVRGNRAAGWAGWLLAALGVATVVIAVQNYREVSRELGLWDAKLAELKKLWRRTPGAIPEAVPDSAALRQEVRIANTVLQQIAVPWDALFREIEARTDESIALLSVQPDLQNRVVRIGGESRSLQAAIDYARRLGTAPKLSGVYLVSHEVKAQDKQRAVSFSLVAAWDEHL